MINGIVFILHSAPAAVSAEELTEALRPHTALAMPLTRDSKARQVAYGSGATCVILLDQVLAAQPDAILNIASPSNSVICCAAGVVLPAALAGYRIVHVQAEFAATSAALRDAVSSKQREAAERNAVGRRVTHTPAMRRAPSHEVSKSSLLARTAWGLAATVVVAGIAAPAIGGRASAARVAEADPLTRATEPADATTFAQPDEVATSQHFEPPPLADLIDHLDRGEPEPAVTVAALHADGPAQEEFAIHSFAAASAEPEVKPETVTAPVGPTIEGSADRSLTTAPVEVEVKGDTMIGRVSDARQPKGGALQNTGDDLRSRATKPSA